jgi:hypothetical protein
VCFQSAKERAGRFAGSIATGSHQNLRLIRRADWPNAASAGVQCGNGGSEESRAMLAQFVYNNFMEQISRYTG